MAATQDYLETLCQKAKTYQQNIYELSCDYNRYEEHEHSYLKDFIGYALYGPPKCKDEKQMSADHFDYLEDQCQVIETIYNTVLECSKEGNTSGTILCSVVYNIIIFEKAQFGREVTEECPEELDIYPIPIFKVKSWKSAEGSCANFYIENNARVYEGFEDYLNGNRLPKCLMVYPKDGVYQADPDFLNTINLATFDCETDFVTPVWLEHRASPAHNLLSWVCSSGDKLFAGASIGCLIGTVGALFTPVGPVVGAGLLIGNGLSAAWSAGRSTQLLVDRMNHRESIGLSERETVGAWLGVAGGVFGIAGSASNVLLGRAVRAGTAASRSARILAYDASLIGSLVVNGVGLTVNTYDMVIAWQNGEGIDSFNVFMTCAHLFFICNTVVNMQFARSFIADNQAQILEEYKNNLRSNRHRKEFKKLVRNTKAAGTSDMQSNEEIIRSINKIASKDEFFAAMVRNRKAFNAAGKKPTFSDGKISLGSGLTIDPVEFAKLPNTLRLNMLSFPGSSTAPVNANVSAHTMSQLNKVSDCNTYLKSQSWYQPETSTQPNGSDIFNKILTQLQNVNRMFEAFKKFVDIVKPVAKAVYEDMLEKERKAKSRKNREENLKENKQDEKSNIQKMCECVQAVATYLWGYLCENLKRLISRKVRETNFDPQNKTFIEKCLNEILDSLDDSVKKNLDKWVNAAYISV